MLDLDDPEIFLNPILYVWEPGYWTIQASEAENLRKYLLKGGFIIFDDFEGPDHWDNMVAQMHRALPDHDFVKIACAQTGSGKTAAFLLPILHAADRQAARARRARCHLTPTRELAAQILEDLNALAVHTPLTGAAVFGGVGMGPQEHAFRSGVDVIVATPGRPARSLPRPTRRLAGLEFLVLDEADRMLDMGFLPDIRRVLRHLPREAADAVLQRDDAAADRGARAEMLKNPVTINLERQAAPAVGITQAVYPVPQELKPALLRRAAQARRDARGARLHAHEAPRQPAGRAPRAARRQRRAHSRQPLAGAADRGARRLQEREVSACWWRPTSPRAASTSRRSATSSTSTCRRARGLHPPRRPHRRAPS